MVIDNNVPLQKKIWTEFLGDDHRLIRARERLGMLKQIYPQYYNFPAWVEDEVKVPGLRRPSLNTLAKAYWFAAERLNKSCPEVAITRYERECLKKFAFYSRKEIYTSFWIGHRCIDLFVPNIRSTEVGGRVMRGLAIEIDGEVHHYESKMKKDEVKSILLHMLGIGHTGLPNWELNEATVTVIHRDLNSCPTLDTRERRRLWERIYALTVAISFTTAEFLQVFREEKT